MKRLLPLILTFFILTLTGCNAVNNTSSDIDINSSVIVSSADESSADSDTFSDEAGLETNSQGSYSQTSTPSKTENTSKPTISNKVDSSSLNQTASTNKTESGSNNQNAESKNENSLTNQETVTYTRFDSAIDVYETKNLPNISTYYDNRCPAWIGIYSIGKNIAIETEIKTKFTARFGYEAKESVVCKLVGKYLVDGYTTPQDIYEYSITDLTYPLLLDEFYVINKQICEDGSGWVGFAAPGSMDSPDNAELVSQLEKECLRIFCEWTGYSREYVMTNCPEKFICYGISCAGYVRTKNGKVMEITYRYTRGINVPLYNET